MTMRSGLIGEQRGPLEPTSESPARDVGLNQRGKVVSERATISAEEKQKKKMIVAAFFETESAESRPPLVGAGAVAGGSKIAFGNLWRGRVAGQMPASLPSGLT